MWGKKTPYLTAFLCIAVSVYVVFNIGAYKKESGVIASDVISYYAYLPAAFVYNDLTLQFTIQDPEKFAMRFWPNLLPNGSRVIKTTMGLSFLYSPFFFIGHYWALNSGHEADGFSMPYKFMLKISALFYVLAGLLFLARVLLKFFSPAVASITLAAIFFGTNLLYYTALESTVSHGYNFALISAFVWLSLKWHKGPNWQKTLLLGLLAGLITLVRPTNILVLLFFALYGLGGQRTLADQLNLFLRQWKLVLLMVAAFWVVWLPQLMYWKILTGSFFFFSYGEERFFWTEPAIIQGLFSYRKGWLLYTPVMVFSVIGIALLWRHGKQFFWAIAPLAIVFIYVTFSWWCWWYGGSYSSRPMVDIYAILAIPLAVFLQWALNVKKVYKIPLLVLVVMFTLLNIKQTIQYHYNTLHYDGMNKEAYWHQFFRIKQGPQYWNLVKSPDYGAALKGEDR